MKLNVKAPEALEKNQPGADKVARYNWIIRNAPGEFLMIPKQELEVDHGYQRNAVNQRRIDALCRTWDWIACGCLVVALRDDNRWFVMDGQHRKLAADMRSDIKELPCLVFETAGRREEADEADEERRRRRPQSCPGREEEEQAKGGRRARPRRL